MGGERTRKHLPALKAVDTNILARALLADDPTQSPLASSALINGAFFSMTVILETAWLMRRRFDRDCREVAELLLGLLSMRTVVVDRPAHVKWAIERSATRGDLVDLLHVPAGAASDAFVTLDRRMETACAPDGPVRIETLA